MPHQSIRRAITISPSMTNYPEKYQHLLDNETWAFVERTNAFYPTDAVTRSVEEQRQVYNAMCREFFAGYPDGVSASDRTIPGCFADQPPIPVRIYQSEQAGDTTILYFHGGGFVVGGLDSHDDVCAEICGRTGFTVVSADYRLCPEHAWPDDTNDVEAVWRAISAETSGPIILAGDSAGGNLAAALSARLKKKVRKPAGQVLIYPGLGSRGDSASFAEHAEAPLLSAEEIRYYKTIRTAGDGETIHDPDCAPLNAADFSGLPQTHIYVAECDPLASDGPIYSDKIRSAGGRAEVFIETGLVHGYLRARHSVARASESFDRIIASIKKLGS